jgi:hypothetical protein
VTDTREAPTGADPTVFTDAERGDTVGRRTRVLIRVLAVLLLAGATLGVAAIRERDRPGDDGLVRPAPSATDADRTDPLAHAGHEVRLLAEEDTRLRTVSLGEAVGVSHVAGTLVLGARPAPYTLADLLRAGAARRLSASAVLLTQPVVVRRGARLSVAAPGVTVRMSSAPDGYTSLVSWGGSITLAGSAKRPLTLRGWDAEAGAGDGETADGRAYVRVKDGALRIAHATLRDLGYWSGRTGGLSLTGSNETTADADLRDVVLEDLHIGLYVSGAQRVRVDHAVVRRPQRHGIELTNRSTDIRLRHLDVRGAGEDGVAVSNGTSHVTVEGATLARSGEYGLDMDGSPLADGPNSAGYGIGNYGGLRIEGVRVLRNVAGAVRVQSVDRVALADSRLVADRSALVVRGRARDVAVSDSVLDSTDGAGVVLTGGVHDARLEGSTVTGRETGVQVDGSTATITGNEITVGTGHGVLVSGSSAEATLSGNTIHGRGSGAVQGDHGATVTEDGESAGRWTYRPEAFMWVQRHSAAMPMLAVLVVPLIGLVFMLRRRRQQLELRRLLEETLVAQGLSAIAAYRPVEVAAGPVSPPEPGPAPEQPAASADETVPQPAPTVPVGLEGREFASGREFAVVAVLESGYPASMVARVLHVPTSRVRDWVAEAAQAS